MQLKSLEISGFKSFADKTKIDFQAGMTGIVGPNGSGKSNIIEAIRWVLGEQAVKSLRGTKMTDVIFAGSANRKPLNMAKVTITFDNSDHFLPLDYAEVSITRKLFRNGDSDYLINNQSCRLKDITNLMIDTGLGKDSFSVISQGRVEAVFNAKPEDRRSIIEDVAGVLKYKKDKFTTENKLAETTDYLDRVNDIIAELSQQKGPLEEQASLARDYQDQKQKFDYLDRSRLVKKLTIARDQLQGVNEKLASAKALVAKYQQQVDAGATKLANLKTQQTAQLKQKDQLAAQNLELTKTIENTQGQQGVDAERRQNQQSEQERLTASLTATEQQIVTQTEQQAQLRQTLSEQQAQVKAVKAQVGELTTATSAAGRQQLADELEKLRNAYIDEKQVQAELNNEAKNLVKQHQQSGSQSTALAERLAQAQANLKRVQTTVDVHNREQRDLENQVNQQQTTLTAQQAQVKTNAEQIDEQQQRWLDAAGLMQREKSRLEALQAVQERYTNFYAGVRMVLQHRQQFSGVAGAVSELLTVPDRYTKAVEVALGGQLQNIVCDTQQTAKTVVNFLKQNHAGRATFLPIERMTARQLPVNTEHDLLQQPGVLGVASELVDCEPKIMAIKRYLLGTTAIVDTLDHAMAISRSRRFRCKLVTVDGETIAASGAITGGATRHDDNGLLQQQQSAEKIAANVEQMQSELVTYEQGLANLKKANQDLMVQVETSRQQLSDLKDHLSQVQAQLQAAQSEQTQLSRQVKALTYEQQQTQADDSYEDLVARNQQAQAANAAKLKDYQAQMQTVQQQQTDYESYQQTQAAKLQAQREQLITLQEHVKQTQRQLEQCTVSFTQAEQTKKQTQADLTAIQTTLASQQMSVAERETVLKTAKAKQTEVEQQRAACEHQLATINDQVEELSNQQVRLQQLAAAATDDYRRLELSQTKLTGEVDHATADLAEKYQLTVAAAQADVSDLALPAITEQLKLLKRGLDEIGTVNLGAIEEFERVKERFDFLNNQAADLKEAKEHLLQTMADLDTTVATRFKTAFDQVAAEFSTIFEQMFGGGKAELILTDPEHLLTSGVDIMAQPPGKKFQRLSLLSGGERALTAITLLFAILAVRPVPFSILDEAEAALDDANVDRFSQYLNDFQTGTQFVIITHRKGTMMHADVLYGVTMEESGVSKMVSVSLADLKEEQK
ncbi:chromosome segregation protein SMC [Lactiplantibacillus paraplantarum]|uniref:Chromosome partition protein Smc n=1 Tax=Lactiplantibacillus paraplantarum TaxID=60520 RepID=A0AAD0TPM1_9LACO|nr:chromosome segregation protein SMC [Lactiplantibacillus paraplantarum]AVW10288.1 chromosome segregation protein SMC [Lactiplantibacillus paraplantarum]AYJ38537.1 chromosome segregation protein SMC [Lactiplantibacillus paraplantarum]ERL43925.1 cell division protein Smc [Lactiplantibacillus paraplantarum]KRL51714.1 cell division protein Smc [Lactiplantibacillus paraplantarum DSM 10667]MCU4683615.1 chromosome segregation protein SMC [Lactiplantibacillus paraplantarum]